LSQLAKQSASTVVQLSGIMSIGQLTIDNDPLDSVFFWLNTRGGVAIGFAGFYAQKKFAPKNRHNCFSKISHLGLLGWKGFLFFPISKHPTKMKIRAIDCNFGKYFQKKKTPFYNNTPKTQHAG